MSTQTGNLGLYRNETVDDTLVALVNNQNINMNIIDSNVQQNTTNLDIARIAKTDTGVADAYVVDTAGTFDRTIEGNLLHFIPSNTNTGACTISEDSQTAKAIKKFDIGTDAYIDLEAEDLKKNTPVQLTWSLTNDFFVLAPKGGAIKYGALNIYTLTTATTALTQRLNLIGKGVFKGLSQGTATEYEWYAIIDGVRFPSSDNYNMAQSGLVIDYPFENSFEFYSENDRLVCIYELEGQLGMSQPSLTGAVTQRINITGGGKLKSISGGGSVSINIDGVDILGFGATGRLVSTCSLYVDYEFESSLEVYTSANTIIDYEIY